VILILPCSVEGKERDVDTTVVVWTGKERDVDTTVVVWTGSTFVFANVTAFERLSSNMHI
jgi:hypothetical protein